MSGSTVNMTPAKLSALMVVIGHDSQCSIGPVDEETVHENRGVRFVPCDCNLEARALAARRLVLEEAAGILDGLLLESTLAERSATYIIAIRAIRAAIERAKPDKEKRG